MSAIGFVRKALEMGVDLETALKMGEAFEAALLERLYPVAVDEVAERRRAYDRERKRSLRLPGDWAQTRVQVFERDGFQCTYCGSADQPLHCDHIIPLSRGGASTPDNLVTACAGCNISKGARTPEEWDGAA